MGWQRGFGYYEIYHSLCPWRILHVYTGYVNRETTLWVILLNVLHEGCVQSVLLDFRGFWPIMELQGKAVMGRSSWYLNWEELDNLIMCVQLQNVMMIGEWGWSCWALVRRKSYYHAPYSSLNPTTPLWFLDIALHSQISNCVLSIYFLFPL